VNTRAKVLRNYFFRYYHRLGIQLVYRNGCIGHAVARLQRIRCSFCGTADSDLRQARRVLIFAYRKWGGFNTTEFFKTGSRSA
jgi:hypothetical protein